MDKKSEYVNEFLNHTGEVIRRNRIRSGDTQEELGNYLGVDSSTVSKYENGKLNMPVSVLPLTSVKYDFSIKQFSYEDDSEKRKIARKLIELSVLPNNYDKLVEDNKLNVVAEEQMRNFTVLAMEIIKATHENETEENTMILAEKIVDVIDIASFKERQSQRLSCYMKKMIEMSLENEDIE